jgi:glycosyltransferase involved in cell wall biosynthesis
MRLSYVTSPADSAIKYYRQILPASYLKQYTDLRFSVFQGGNEHAIAELLCKTDLLLLQGLSDERWIEIARMVKKDNVKIVIDYDDNFFKVNPLSPHYEFLGTEEFIWVMPNGNKVKIWEDGKNFSIEKNRKNLDKLKEGLELADLITVTTDVLGEVYKPYCDNVVSLPNCVDLNVWKKLPLMPHKEIRIGWFGGHSHYHDWRLLKEVLPAISKKYPQVKFVIMGQTFWDVLKHIKPEQIEVHTWVHNMAYPYKAAILDLDMMIIPLQKDDFNICKSPIKWIEAGSLFVPSVASAISPYIELHKEDNGIFVDDDPLSWISAISMLVENEELRKSMGKAARRTVIEQFDMNTQWKLWKSAYEGLA